MPVSGQVAIILSTAVAVGTVVAALAVVGLTRFIVRLAAEPDRGGRRPTPARDHRWWRGR